MKYKFYQIPVLSPEQAEASLNTFCSQHHVLTVDREFVADGANSYWALCVSYADNSGSLAATQESRRNRVDYKEQLSEADFAVYSQLRDLRKQLAEREGTAVYNIFTNEQLATMVQQRSTSKAALGSISGVGAAKLEKYADAFIACLIEQWGFNSSGQSSGDET